MQIFGIPVSNHTREEILSSVDAIFKKSVYRRMVTLNPEFLMLAETSGRFRDCLMQADVQVIDGIGVGFAFALGGGFLRSRFPGTDLLDALLKLALSRRLKVFFAMRSDGLSHADEVIQVLTKKYPGIQVSACDLHPEGDFLPSQAQQADMIICNFGAPWQEYFLERVRRHPGTLKLGIGVGGAVDFVTGKLRRAPHWMRSLGCEWLYRLWQQPRRFPRIFRAAILFPIRLLFARI